MLRRILSMLVVISLILPQALAAMNAAPEMTLLGKTAVVEKTVYGSEQTGALVERIGKVEKDLFGTNAQEALAGKLDRLYSYCKDNKPGAPSLITKFNTIEWSLLHSISNDPVNTRLDSLERIMFGSSTTGPVDTRIGKLLKLALVNGWPDVSEITVAKDTLVKIKISEELGTKKSRVGDPVSFQASSDVFVDGKLIIAKGAMGLGSVTKVEPSRNFGRDAKLEISFDSITAIDGTTVPTFLGDKAKEETKSMAKAAGATVAGLVLLGPIGVVGGAFVHGQDINLPAGTEVYIQTKDDQALNGITLQ